MTNHLDVPPDDSLPGTPHEDRVAAFLALASLRFNESGNQDEKAIQEALRPYREGRRDPFQLIEALANLPMFVEIERADSDPPDEDTLEERLRDLEGHLMERQWRFPGAIDNDGMWGMEPP
jgi:hypothetical protein